MRKPRQSLSSKYVHVTQRGLGKRIIFEDDQDKRYYLKTLASKLKNTNISVLSWVIMDNHIHILMRVLPEDLSLLMKRLGTSYAQYFNGRHGHVGKVFQGRFSSSPIKSDAYLMSVIRYIHKNPEKAEIVNMDTYPWSSYQELCGRSSRIEGKGICDIETALDLFGGRENFIAFHKEDGAEDELVRIDGYKARISDEEARGIATGRYGADFADRISSMPKAERNEALRLLKDLGVSIRQLQRLTGIGRGPITKA